MFDWLFVAPHSERVVASFEKDDLVVDTAAVTDGTHPFETGITWPSEYHGSASWVIVEAYDTKEEAQLGHNKWVAAMTAADLPDELRDCSNSAIRQFADAFTEAHVVLRRDRSTFPGD